MPTSDNPAAMKRNDFDPLLLTCIVRVMPLEINEENGASIG
jgi:hypothetical protein